MSTLDPKLNTIKVLIVVSKTERSLLLRQLMRAFSTQLQVVNSVYEAAQFCKTNLPHLIFSDAQLSDGSVLDLRTKLNTTPILAGINMVALQQAMLYAAGIGH